MRQLISWHLSILLLAGMAAGAQAPNSNQNGQSPGNPPADSATPPGASTTATTPAPGTPSVTVTGQKPRNEPTLPKLAPDQFTDCHAKYNIDPDGRLVFWELTMCQFELARDERIVIDKCVNRDRKNAPPLTIQACTELLGRNLLQGRDRFYLFVNRALAYVARGDKQHALDDYNTAVQVAPKRATPYYYRGVFYAQSDVDAALRDLDTALSKLRPSNSVHA